MPDGHLPCRFGDSEFLTKTPGLIDDHVPPGQRNAVASEYFAQFLRLAVIGEFEGEFRSQVALRRPSRLNEYPTVVVVCC